ncbi:IS110 family transposase [Burkholderia gladioli]|uniref:Transposase IS116/IS110/IS902 family protein n=1 Tax=Burkholderia gladioli (strain BSR3) TaxID=999541 RepID=F2LS00_BURGS|nr:IS110 family transposase [Burkholderia gladioli]AEA65455.1 transposase IS116/IS110/IS902 family protein [Burkholderia gladioli BSR3]MBW5288281.1 IS110 family transposase [Burkholderia gladioli]
MEQHEVILGVDTHLDTHVGAVVSETGKLLGTLSVSAETAGYLKLLTWANSLGLLRRAGVEGTGTYGAGLARVLRDHEIEVFEVNRPDRAARRSRGKSDPTDAENAARAVLAGKATAIPKEQSGAAEAMRAVSVARRSAVKAKTQAINQLRALLVSAPQDIRDRLLKTNTAGCVSNCARLRSLGNTPMLQALATTLRILAKRYLALAEELTTLDAMLEQLTLRHAPRLRERFGVGPQTAAVLVSVAGDNPERLKSDAALAALCGTSPLQASSGKTVRHRLNRGGDRAANNALWTIAMVRMRSDPRTRAYVERRTKEGMSNKEIHRCLKRYIVRELYPLILADLADSARAT